MTDISKAASFIANAVSMSDEDRKLVYLQQTGIHVLDCGCWTGNQRNFGLICEDELAVLDVDTSAHYPHVHIPTLPRMWCSLKESSMPLIQGMVNRLQARSGLQIKIVRSAKLRPWFANEESGDYKGTAPSTTVAFIPDTHIGMGDDADDFFNRDESLTNYHILIKLLNALRAENVRDIVQLGDYLDIWEAEACVLINDYICDNWKEISHCFKRESHSEIRKRPHYWECYLRYLDRPPYDFSFVFDRIYGSEPNPKTLRDQMKTKSSFMDSELSFRAMVSIHTAWLKKVPNIGLGPIQDNLSTWLRGNHDFRFETSYEVKSTDKDLLFIGLNRRIRVEHGHRFDPSNNTFLFPSQLDNTIPNPLPPKWTILRLVDVAGRKVTWTITGQEITEDPNIENDWWNTFVWKKNVEMMRTRMAMYLFDQIPKAALDDAQERKAALLKLPRVLVVGHTHYPDIFFLPIPFSPK